MYHPQPDPVPNPYSSHYPNQYPILTSAVPSSLPYFPSFQHPQHPKPAPVQAEISSPDPPEPSITPTVASKSVQRLISLELQRAGFDSAVQPAVKRLEVELVTFVQQLFQRTHEYANLANRADLYKVKTSTRKRKRGQAPSTGPITLVAPSSRSPSPELLASDDEDASSTIPTTLKSLPSYFPDLPPKHTYLQTPASPPKKAALPSLEKKLKTAALVQESLQSLLLATEDTMNQEDGELLGHIVNWEMSTQLRKRWKVGTK